MRSRFDRIGSDGGGLIRIGQELADADLNTLAERAVCSRIRAVKALTSWPFNRN